jgi:hypothetical protein
LQSSQLNNDHPMEQREAVSLLARRVLCNAADSPLTDENEFLS